MAPGEPDRWLNLILLLVQCGQLEKAEKVIPEAEAALPKDKIPLALARYCGVLGLGYQEAKQADLKTKWCDAANSWFKKARDAKPDDSSVNRIYTEFLIRSGQLHARWKLASLRDGRDAGRTAAGRELRGDGR